MYGYEPQKENEPSSWHETFMMVMAAFQVIVPVMLVIVGVMAGLILTLVVSFYDGRLALIPIVVFGGSVLWYLRRQRRKNEEEQAKYFND